MAALPEYLTEQTEETIRQRILDALPDDLDKAEGSYIWDAVSPVAIELVLAAIWAREVLRRGFAQTTFGAYLDMRTAEHGLTRRPAVKATGRIAFTGAVGTVIPAGTQVSTLGSEAAPAIFFATMTAVKIGAGGTVTANIEAVEAGKSSNVAAGAIKLLAQSVSGVTAVTNTEPASGGADEEADESLLERYLQKVRQPGTSGNKADYINWALEVPGVGGVKVIPLWNGPLSVKVVIVDSEKQPAGPELVDTVYEYIESLRPIGADVTAVSATGKAIDVAATVVLAEGYTLQGVTDAFIFALEEYFRGIAFEMNYVSHARIGTLLLGTNGVLDYSGMTLNGGTANVPLADEEIPVLGNIELGV